MLVPRISFAVSGVQYLSDFVTPKLFPTPMMSVVQFPPVEFPPVPLISKGPVVDLVLLTLVSQMDSAQLLRTTWDETARVEVVKATTAAAVRVVKCMVGVAGG